MQAKRRFVVLGGGGFIGSATVRLLLQQGHEVVVLDRERTPIPFWAAESPRLTWLRGDYLNKSDLQTTVSGADAVIHLISTTVPASSALDPVFDVQSNLIGSLQLLASMQSASVGRLVFVSSGGTVYGNPVRLPIDESHPTEPIVSYGITKLAIEKYVVNAKTTHGLRGIVLRLSNPYGPGQRPETAQGAVGVFLRRTLDRQPITIWGDGSTVRDYIYVDDVARAIVKACDYEGPLATFNIGSGVGTSIKELLAAIEVAVGWGAPHEYTPSRPFDIAANVLSIERARMQLSWCPEYDLRTGLALTVQDLSRSTLQ
jgi:UDP-glucose 4-epimerase